MASLCTPVAAVNVVGESWVLFDGLAAVVEVSLLADIIRSAWARLRG